MTAPHNRHSTPAVERALTALALFAIIFSITPVASGQGNALSLSNAWVRMTLPSRPTAGYFTIKNDGDTARVLRDASSPACGNIMLHRSISVNGMDKMVMVDKVTIAAHGMLKFAPRGYHLMCMQPTADMRPGRIVPVTLRFEDGTTLTGRFKVYGATGK